MSVLTIVLSTGPSLLAYRPFLDPLPLWDHTWALLPPLTVAVAVVYKSIRCASMRQVPAEAAKITAWILAGMVAAGLAIQGLLTFLGRRV